MSQSGPPEKGKLRVDNADTTTATHDGTPNVQLRGSGPRMLTDRLFRYLCVATAGISVAILCSLLISILYQGLPSLSWTLISSSPEPEPSEAGVRPALFGTIWVCLLCASLTLPIGIATAILLEEFKPRSRATAWLYSIIQLNITNLAGVPSVVYGILGLTAFVSMFNMFGGSGTGAAVGREFGVTYYDQFFSEGDRAILILVPDGSAEMATPKVGMQAFTFPRDSEGGTLVDYSALVPTEINVINIDDEYPDDEKLLERTIFDDSEAGRISAKSWYYFRLPLGRGVLAGALTLMLVILPVIIISSQEALRSVPSSLRDGASGLGATPWQVVWNVTLPSAIPGIMTGSILAMSRAIGETAPILIIAGIVYIRTAPSHLMDDFTVLPLQIYNWISRPQAEFHQLAAGSIIVLLLILLSFNAVAVFIRQKMQKPLS